MPGSSLKVGPSGLRFAPLLEWRVAANFAVTNKIGASGKFRYRQNPRFDTPLRVAW
jgi:hypothetical protein